MYFVMLNHPSKNVIAMPLIELKEGSSDIAFYNTYEEACAAAENSSLGANFGYEVFCLGEGI